MLDYHLQPCRWQEPSYSSRHKVRVSCCAADSPHTQFR
eukprot:COSAG02_NODE_63106_length_264_cov_0.624242_1_plen_37_part_01